MIEVEVNNIQTAHAVDERRLAAAVRCVLEGEGAEKASISVAVVDGKEMHRLNREYLQHDYTTDVLSFCLERAPGYVDGEIIVSADMAAESAERYRWSAVDELLLYVIHGALHLTGQDDSSDEAAQAMRTMERRYLQQMGAELPVVGPAATHEIPRTIGDRFPLPGRGATVSGDLVLWLFVAGLMATCLASIGARALRGFSRQALAQVCKQRDQLDLLGDILSRHDAVALGVESAQVVAIAAMILSGGFWAFRRINAEQAADSPRTWLVYGLSGMLLLLAVEIWAPRVVVRLWGAGFLARTWKFWILLSRLMLPVTQAELAAERLLARLLGREQDRPSDELFEEEIRSIFSKGEREGLLEQEAREMIEGVIELGDATVSQIMTPRTDMVCMPVSLSLEEAAQLVVDSAHTRIPVYDKNRDDIVGILYVRDLLPELLRMAERPARSLQEIIRKPFFVPESKPVNAVLREFQRNRNHMAIVLDEYGGVSGLVTIKDALEEIVGEIVDEHDDMVQGIRRIDERAAECLARTRIGEVNEHLKTAIPETGEFDTIGGFVFHELGRIPKRGEQLVWNNVRITVLEVSRRRVERVRIEILDTAPSETS